LKRHILVKGCGKDPSPDNNNPTPSTTSTSTTTTKEEDGGNSSDGTPLRTGSRNDNMGGNHIVNGHV